MAHHRLHPANDNGLEKAASVTGLIISQEIESVLKWPFV
jgi:hypothetical protein